ncbi:MAG: hypothetical protein KME46_32870 [Brasilonema angustatum HA4187-MV1]|jgi:hypothetical protein|nr:hypothetical protein [Brasilonema angustatum HA4187-MV1]
MGEAKRRRELDPEFGNEKNVLMIINCKTHSIRPTGLPAIILTQKGDKFGLLTPPKLTVDERNFIKVFFCQLLDVLIKEIPIKSNNFLALLDFTESKSKQIVTLRTCEDTSNYDPDKKRFWCSTAFPIDVIQDVLNLEKPLVTETATEPKARKEVREHVRAGHLRRVAYGKNRSMRKWVEIPSVVVNQH